MDSDDQDDPFDDDVVALVANDPDDVADQGPWKEIRVDDLESASLDVDFSAVEPGGGVRDLERGAREYSFSVDIELDPEDPDDRETIRKLRRYFFGGEGGATASRSRR